LPKYLSSFQKYLLLATFIIIVDQLSKLWIISLFPISGMGIEVTPFFNLVRVHNEGAAFSFLANAGGWQRWLLMIVVLGVSVVFTYLIKKGEGSKGFKLGLSFMLGGALGNVIDRIYHGYVIDFFDFHFSWLESIFYQGHYPSFNIADSAITGGVCIILIDELIRWMRKKR
jgi:signal peptidase II